MIGPVETAFRDVLPPLLIGWPVLWPNDEWPEGTALSQGNMPLTPAGTPAPAAEVRIIGGDAETTIGAQGARRALRMGLVHIDLSVQRKTGTGAITGLSDAIATAMNRVTVWTSADGSRCIRTGVVRIDDDVVTHEDGDRFCRTVSIPWDFDYPD